VAFLSHITIASSVGKLLNFPLILLSSPPIISVLVSHEFDGTGLAYKGPTLTGGGKGGGGGHLNTHVSYWEMLLNMNS